MSQDDRFKRQLAPALELWVSEDLISREQALRLRGYYQLDAHQGTARGRFGSLLLVFGAVLVGLGLITFVAANWDAISRSERAIAGLVVMLGLDVAGYQLWRRPESHRLGSALLLLGAFALGGNIALMAQWFQVGGTGWGLFLGWSMGTFALALGLRHGLVGALSCLAMMGVVVGGSEQALFLYPWVFAGVFLPLALWCDSRTLLYSAIAGLVMSAVALVVDLGSVGLTAALALAALAVWSWSGWQEARLPASALPVATPALPVRPDQDALHHARAPQVLAWLAVLVLLQCWAFRATWSNPFEGLQHLEAMPTQNLASMGLCLLAAVASWVWTLPRQSLRSAHWVLGGVVAVLFALVAAASYGESLVWVMNVLLFVTELGLLWLGLREADRRWFWLGLSGLTFQVLARFIEYDTDLVAKSGVFTVWGVVLIGAGWWFERAVAERRGAALLRPREEH